MISKNKNKKERKPLRIIVVVLTLKTFEKFRLWKKKKKKKTENPPSFFFFLGGYIIIVDVLVLYCGGYSRCSGPSRGHGCYCRRVYKTSDK